MKKSFSILIILLLFMMKANAQFVGFYNMRDGGVDMPHSALFVLPSHEFVLFYYAGYKVGTWIEIDKANIKLTETKVDINPIKIFAKEQKDKTEISLDVYGLSESYATIDFSKDTIGKKEFQPVFNENANCLGDDYHIKKQIGAYNFVTFTLPSDPDFPRNKTSYPYKAVSYTFPLNKKYTDYVVLHFEDAFRDNMSITITKDKNGYKINGEKELERLDLTEDMKQKIELGKRSIDKDNSTLRFGKPIPFISSSKIDISKPTLKPIFIATCAGDPGDVAGAEGEEIQKSLVSAERPNGFYSVLNFKETHDQETYKLAEEPSLSQKDILTVDKVVSRSGGFEMQLTFTKEGAIKFAMLTSKNINKPIAIVINKHIVSAPVVYSTVTGGKAIISGNFSESEIDELIESLKK